MFWKVHVHVSHLNIFSVFAAAKTYEIVNIMIVNIKSYLNLCNPNLKINKKQLLRVTQCHERLPQNPIRSHTSNTHSL